MTASALVYASDRQHRKIMRIVLEQEGFKVLEAATASETAVTAWAEHPDLIVVSLDDGEIGLEIAQGFRSSHAFDGTRVLAFAIDGPQFDQQTVIAAGFDGYAIGANGVASVRSEIRSFALNR